MDNPSKAEIVTRKSFENSIPSSDWLAILRVCFQELSSTEINESISAVLNLLLNLLASWPANEAIVDYLATLVRGHLLPLHTYFTGFLRFTRTTEIVDPRTVDMLCQLGVRLSAEMPFEPVISITETTQIASVTLMDAFTLVRGALNIPYSPLHDLHTSASEVLLLMIQYSRPLFGQFLVHDTLQFLTISHDVMQHPGLRPDLVSSLEGLIRLLGDILAVSNALPSTHTELLALTAQPTQEINSEESDIITFSLFIKNIVDYAAHPYGCGNLETTVSTLVGLHKWSNLAISQFCAELIRAAFAHYSEAYQSRRSYPNNTSIWSSFLYARLPALLQALLARIGAQPYPIMESAMGVAFEKLPQQPNYSLPFTGMEIDDASPELSPDSFRVEFLNSLFQMNLITASAAKSLCEAWKEEVETESQLLREMNDMKSLESFVDFFIDPSTSERVQEILNLFVKDYRQQEAFAIYFFEKVTTECDQLNLEAVSPICKLLSSRPLVMDTLALHISITQLVKRILYLVDHLDWEGMDDPQSSMTSLGPIILFLQATIGRLNFSSHSLRKDDEGLSADYLMRAGSTDTHSDLTSEEKVAYTDWHKALFDANSDGIEDSLVRSRNPKILLKLLPVLVSDAIAACGRPGAGSNELAALNNGINYLQESILSWTLVGVIKCVALQMERAPSSVHAEVLSQLLKSAPANLTKMLYRTLGRLTLSAMDPEAPKFLVDFATILNGMIKPTTEQSSISSYSPVLTPAQLIRTTFLSLRSTKAVALDVPLCLRMSNPLDLVANLHRELYPGSQFGDPESCRRVTVHALCCTSQKGPDQPWLLPVFFFSYIPSILHHSPSQDTLHIEALSGVITASLRLQPCLGKGRWITLPRAITPSFSTVCRPTQEIRWKG
ncbi:hypothetical protein PIIN_09172 [Serendipita indica DSM 11827]|uniref:Mediator of RNA polymerase II transcription subunit 5 n=1 Tax=Serendipita indica (strain DSM 11827) TaxID=1109443 RepID=G4TV45_SERID|nr:hypothetical protein PIIN_09172 [Serendipita indica DSM 11827]